MALSAHIKMTLAYSPSQKSAKLIDEYSVWWPATSSLSASTTVLFLGGWLPPVGIAPFTWIPGWAWFFLKISLVLFGFLWVRATFPRYRYDQLMRLGWKVFLPFTLFWVVLTAGALVTFGWLPHHG